MGSFLLVLVVVLVAAALVVGVIMVLNGGDPGLAPAEPDGRSVPLPTTRPLSEEDMISVRFDTGLRGYRMEQVDRALRRAAYDVGYKDEMISVLEAEVTALRDGRLDDAEILRKARESANQPIAVDPTEQPGDFEPGGDESGGDGSGGDGSGGDGSGGDESGGDEPDGYLPGAGDRATAEDRAAGRGRDPIGDPGEDLGVDRSPAAAQPSEPSSRARG
jgi:DivIVA domain-containing protein